MDRQLRFLVAAVVCLVSFLGFVVGGFIVAGTSGTTPYWIAYPMLGLLAAGIGFGFAAILTR